MVTPTTFLVLMITLFSLLFGSFDIINVMTQGGPLDATNIFIYDIYQNAFKYLPDGLRLGPGLHPLHRRLLADARQLGDAKAVGALRMTTSTTRILVAGPDRASSPLLVIGAGGDRPLPVDPLDLIEDPSQVFSLPAELDPQPDRLGELPRSLRDTVSGRDLPQLGHLRRQHRHPPGDDDDDGRLRLRPAALPVPRPALSRSTSATMMIPTQVTMIPTFIIVVDLGWIDTYRA